MQANLSNISIAYGQADKRCLPRQSYYLISKMILTNSEAIGQEDMVFSLKYENIWRMMHLWRLSYSYSGKKQSRYPQI